MQYLIALLIIGLLLCMSVICAMLASKKKKKLNSLYSLTDSFLEMEIPPNIRGLYVNGDGQVEFIGTNGKVTSSLTRYYSRRLALVNTSFLVMGNISFCQGGVAKGSAYRNNLATLTQIIFDPGF